MKNLQLSDPMSAAEAEGLKDISRRVIGPPKCAVLHGRRPLPWSHFAERDYLHFAYTGGDLGESVCFARVGSRYVIGEPVYFGEALVPGERGFVRYRRDGAYVCQVTDDPPLWSWKVKVLAPRFCPQACARRFGVIVDVRPERLHAITEDDAKREGVTPFPYDPEGDCWTASDPSKKHLTAFEYLWGEINGWQGESRARAPWPLNPWVFRIEWVSISRDEALQLDGERKAAA